MVHLDECIKRFDVDFFCMTETGVHWKLLPPEDRLWERVRTWGNDRRVTFGYNTRDALARRSQYGGTAILGIGDMVPKIQSRGYDASGLGRWCWFKIQGKHDVTIRLVSAYRPCSQTSHTTSLHTVYAQHLRVLSKDPIASFWNDLRDDLAKWRDEGDHVIVCGDWNQAVTGEEITGFMSSCGLKEALTHIHGSAPPATYQRGSSSIDGIFVSSDLLGVRGGYLEYGATPGDHRGIWIDVPQELFLGYNMPKVPPKTIRHLQRRFPESTQKYKETLHNRFLKRNVYGMIYKLREEASYPLSMALQDQYNRIDRLMESLKHSTAKQCRPKRAGGRAFSDTLQNARREIHLWSLVKRRLLGCNVHARTIIRARKKTRIQNSNVTLEEATDLLDRAHRHYRAVRKMDTIHRLDFQRRLSEQRAKEGNIAVATEIKNQQLREVQRRIAMRAKYTLHRNQSCGTTMIQVQTENGRADITDKEEMERRIIAENEEKYHQTEQRCPLLRGQLLEDIGLLGDGPAVEDILAGTYECPDDASDTVKMWLQTLKVENVREREPIIQTFREYRRGWKLAKEFTSSGDLHFGHFKVEAEHDMLAWANYVMGGLPRATGFVPTRWRKGTDVMLLKKEGLFFLEKLRTIVLFESDFNFENKRLGREAMSLALAQDLITEEQYSRPGRSAQDNALNKRLMFDYVRLRRQPFGVCACDLKSCYDRIVHNAAALALRRVGIRESDIVSMFGTIQTMIHKVRTVFGDSRITYCADNPDFLLPVQGTCQGNGAGPSIWSILCSTIFEVLHKQGFGSLFCYALSRGIYSLCGFAYVDDCDLFHLGDDIDEVFEGLTKMLDMWDRLMEVTGAALAPDKCWWYLVDFKWNNGRWSYSDEGHCLGLEVRNRDGVTEKLKYLTCDIAKEMLGVYIAPDGNQSKQMEVMRKKAVTWGNYMKEGSLRHYESWVTLNTTIIKSLEYPLAATTLSQSELRHIVSPAINSGLHCSGFGKHFPRSILYAPYSAQGMALPNLFHTQSIRHVKDIVDQTWRHTPSSKFLLCNLESVKLEAGIDGYLFESTLPITWMNTPNLWVMDTLAFCQAYNIRFREPGDILKTKRVKDVLIMPAVAAQKLPKSMLQAVNRCRMYLRVCTLSDICTANGKAIHPKVLKRTPPGKRNSFIWPPQGKPSGCDWRCWESAINTVFRQDNIFHSGLGHWTVDEEEYVRDWDFFLTRNGELVKHENQLWTTYSRFVISGKRYKRFDLGNVRNVRSVRPRGCLWRTSVDIVHGVATCHGEDYNVVPLLLPRRSTLSLEERLQEHPDTEWACDNLQGVEWEQVVTRHLIAGTAIAVSDGSWHPKRKLGSMSWIVAGHECYNQCLEGGGMIPGPPESQDAFRSEAAGLLGLLLILTALAPRAKNGSVTVLCDGKSALTKSMLSSRYTFSSNDKSFDIISRIIHLREQLPIHIDVKHVRGHQDDITDELSFSEVLNVRMDARAKSFLFRAQRQNFVPVHHLPIASYGISQVTTNQTVVTSQLMKTLQTYVGFQDGIAWWIKKGRLTHDTASLVDWKVVEKTLKEATFGRRKFITKWASNHMPVGVVQKRKRFQDTDVCPRCLCPGETLQHVMRCTHKKSYRLWHKSLRDLDRWLRRVGTDPEIVRALILILPRWHADELHPTYCPSIVSEPVREAVRDQHKIGWDQFLSGLFSKKWSDHQDMYYKTKKKRNTGHRWAIKLSNRIWDIQRDQWNHRNNCKYKQSVRDKLQGKEELIYACQLELDFGLLDLDPIFIHFFDTDIDTLEHEPTTYIKAWFATIRGAREQSGWEYHNNDRVSDALRKWVGLSMERKYRKT